MIKIANKYATTKYPSIYSQRCMYRTRNRGKYILKICARWSNLYDSIYNV